jgi:hypothetical protein
VTAYVVTWCTWGWLFLNSQLLDFLFSKCWQITLILLLDILLFSLGCVWSFSFKDSGIKMFLDFWIFQIF